MMLKLLRYYLSLLYWSQAPVLSMRKMQLRKFKRLFNHARQHSRFYREFYGDHGVLDLQIREFADIQRVPIIQKDILRKYPTQDIMTCRMGEQVHVHHTSGSTGEPFEVAFSEFEDYTAHVRLMKALRKAGYNPFRPMVLLSRYEPGHDFRIESDLKTLAWGRAKLGLFRRELISVFDPPAAIIRKLEAVKPHLVWTTPSIIELVALELQKFGKRLDIPLVLLMSETISPAQEALFRDRIGPRFIDLYGCMESPSIGFGINQTSEKSIFCNSALIEIVHSRPQDGLIVGDVVLTNLVNRTMPMIRYDLGDYAQVLEDGSSPGRRIGRVYGRNDDILYFGERYTLTYHQSYQMFRGFRECLQYKFVEKNAGQIVLQLRTSEEADREMVKRKALGIWQERYPDYPLVIEWQDHFPIDRRTGKFKVIEKPISNA